MLYRLSVPMVRKMHGTTRIALSVSNWPPTISRSASPTIRWRSSTSGTTGRPKGVVITHRGITHNVMNMALMMRRGMLIASTPPAIQQRQSAGLLGTHLFHIGGIAAIVNSALTGTKIVMLHKWDVDDVLRLGKAEQVTGLGGVPTMVRKMLSHPTSVISPAR